MLAISIRHPIWFSISDIYTIYIGVQKQNSENFIIFGNSWFCYFNRLVGNLFIRPICASMQLYISLHGSYFILVFLLMVVLGSIILTVKEDLPVYCIEVPSWFLSVFTISSINSNDDIFLSNDSVKHFPVVCAASLPIHDAVHDSLWQTKWLSHLFIIWNTLRMSM